MTTFGKGTTKRRHAGGRAPQVRCGRAGMTTLVKKRAARAVPSGDCAQESGARPNPPGDMSLHPPSRRPRLAGVVSALAGMAFVPVVAGARPNTIDWARRALHVAARADSMARKPVDSS